MNNVCWVECMKRFKKETRGQRVGDFFAATRPTRPVLLYSDNYSAHSSAEQKESLTRHMVIDRPLIPNATHIQQPTDQRVGRYLKNNMRRQYLEWKETLLDEVQSGERDPKTDKVKRAGVRLKIVEFTAKIVSDLKEKPDFV